MQVLCVLTREPGRIISRAELIEEVWAGAHVTDDAVSAAIYQLRRAIGDRPRAPRYLETIPKSGYRWLLPVDRTPVSPTREPETIATQTSAHALRPPPTPEVPPTPPAAPRLSATASGADIQKWASMIGLAFVVALFSLALTSARSSEESTILGTSAVTAANTSIDSPTSPETEFRSAYLRGWYLLNQRSAAKLPAAFDELRRAIEVDPSHAGAHGGLAAAYAMQVDLGIGDVEEARAAAKRSLARATALDKTRAEVQYALGLTQLVFEQSLSQGRRHLEAAVRADARNPVFHGTLAWAWAAHGQTADAVAAARRALDLDPTSLRSHLDLASLLAFDDQFVAAATVVEQALVLEPNSGPALAQSAWVLAHLGRETESYSRFRRALRMLHASEQAIASYDAAWREEGLPGTLRWRAEKARAQATAGKGSWTSSAKLQARAGVRDAAMHDLERAMHVGDRSLPFVLDSPDFDFVRTDSRFAAILQHYRALN